MAQMAQRESNDTAGDLLRQYRLAAGLTQEELAERSGISTRTIGSIERGTLQRPRAESLRLLAEALALTQFQYDELRTLVRAHQSRDYAIKDTPASSPTSARDPLRMRYTLPMPPTPLVGREREVALAMNLLRRAEVRLLTLYGPPGVGKTRLALQVTLDIRDEFADGVAFVTLAPFREPDRVMAAVAQAVGLHATGTQPSDILLRDFLADKQLLLVLDNCEQALAASPRIGHLLGTCSGVKALVTSREVLRVRGEHELSIPPLALADLSHLPSVEDLGRIAAVNLFVQRAHAVKPTFALTHDNARAVAEICARLDGLPLALELAAARVKILPPHALIARLDHRLQLLTHDMRDLPERHHALRDAVAWSYELLTSEEQQIFVQLAVFSGGWTLEAAEAVCAAHGEHRPEIVDMLTSLVDKSLVQQEETASSESRFSMLETIREYALEQLATQRDVEALHRRHAEYYATWAEAAELYFTGPEQSFWFTRAATEQGNVRTALQWTCERSELQDDGAWQASQQEQDEIVRAREAVTLGLRLAGALGVYWSIRGPFSEGQAWLERFLALASAQEHRESTVAKGMAQAEAAVRAKALRMAAQLAEHEYNFRRASAWLEESLRLYRELGDREGEAAALNRLGIATLDAGEYAQAEEWFQHGLALRRVSGDIRGMAGALTNLGVVSLHLGEYEQARSRLEEALACYHEVGDITHITDAGDVEMPTVGAANVLADLGVVTYYLGDYNRADELLKQGLAMFQQLGFSAAVAVASHFLGNVAREQGDTNGAGTQYMQALDLYRTHSHPQGAVQCLEDVARWASICGQVERAAQLWGAVEGLRRSTPGLLRPPGERARYERDVAALRRLLGEEEFAAAWRAGHSLSLERAIACAQEIATLPTAASPGGVRTVAG